MEKEPLLEMRDIHVDFGGVKALDGVDLSIDESDIVALMGPNGAGKSTILKAIFGIAPPSSGTIKWNGSKVVLKPYELLELGIALVPQGKRVFPHLSVRENIEIGGHAIRNRAVLKERVEGALELFPALKEKLSQKSGQLSGGQQQMVALARGLVTDPKLLLLDEPSLGLAPKVVKEVFEKVEEINRKRGTAIVVVEHNLKSLLSIANKAYVLDKGKIVSQGDGKKFLDTNILEEVFRVKV